MRKPSLNMAGHLGFGRDDSGQAQIEFAVTVMTILITMFLTFELCNAVYTYVVLSDAANEGLRYAIVHSSDGADTNTKAVVTKYIAASMNNFSGINVTVSTAIWSPPNTVTVNVTCRYVPFLGFLSSPPTMHAYAQGRFVN
jgi:Flp pilus assembly protein TadG